MKLAGSQIFLTFPEQGVKAKRRTIRRSRGVQPRHIALPLQWLFRPLSGPHRPHHAARHAVSVQTGRKTLAALQSRGRLRLVCPDWVHTVAFPFAFRPKPLCGRNHPSLWLGARQIYVNHATIAVTSLCWRVYQDTVVIGFWSDALLKLLRWRTLEIKQCAKTG
ncbi:hypothetical protein H4S14_001297 [Agrobacterium vitis]|nr:hypothetical protein [Agrobacterium vitis]MBE1437559.1 hypothetical protein [Agrobacterium vitis]